ncbi:hypothetical protein GCM10010508_17160 [Streptomyces naganishii JCM 4654]|uniref:Uncharacterized protein n=1 Tax=Streptomyces naganishii JCM 4654 TaxID=1306179 RepID=A0A918Y255_9ACTN|nr:hypothetical protein GCM10010508_17160 [Streptomyces naganishii JCM 4654]
MYWEPGCTLMVWVHRASSWPDGVAFRAPEPEWTGLVTAAAPDPAEHVQFERPLSKPGLATKLVVAAPAEPEFTSARPAAARAVAPAPARTRRATVERGAVRG